MEVDILIDRITDCLIDTRTGKELEKNWKRSGNGISVTRNTDKTEGLQGMEI